MSTTTDNECVVAGDFLECPADAEFSYGDVSRSLEATLMCPLNSAVQSDFIGASQRGVCQCDSQLVNTDAPDNDPIQCDCFACPVTSRFGFGYTCNKNIVGPCHTFNCDGQCNGEFSFNLDPKTFAPTEAPTDAAQGRSIALTALAVLFVMRMIR